MAKFEVIMPKLGESIIEATITKWLKQVGEAVEEDGALVEIATDKVDSEIPSPVEGKIIETLYAEGDVVAVGLPIAVIEIEGDDVEGTETLAKPDNSTKAERQTPEPEKDVKGIGEGDYTSTSRFYSPLIKSIAKKENISLAELEQIAGSGKDNRVNKQDILNYLEGRGQLPAAKTSRTTSSKAPGIEAQKVVSESGDEIVVMNRMHWLIADHMVMSKQVSPHVTSFVEVDVTSIVNWRNRVKERFIERENQKSTFTPIFIEATAETLRDFLMVNASVDGSKMIIRKKVNIGMATALPNGNLIVSVIKNADELNLGETAKRVNDLANRARNNKLDPDEVQGGNFTVTNFGRFDSLTGTSIINQPQVAILGLVAIKKRPVVLKTAQGDVIAIRRIMILSLAYDHRIVDGAVGGMYLKALRDKLESFDVN